MRTAASAPNRAQGSPGLGSSCPTGSRVSKFRPRAKVGTKSQSRPWRAGESRDPRLPRGARPPPQPGCPGKSRVPQSPDVRREEAFPPSSPPPPALEVARAAALHARSEGQPRQRQQRDARGGRAELLLLLRLPLPAAAAAAPRAWAPEGCAPACLGLRLAAPSPAPPQQPRSPQLGARRSASAPGAAAGKRRAAAGPRGAALRGVCVRAGGGSQESGVQPPKGWEAARGKRG